MPEFPNESGEAAYALITALLDHFRTKGVLTAEEVRSIRVVAADNLVASPSNQARSRAAAFLVGLNTPDK